MPMQYDTEMASVGKPIQTICSRENANRIAWGWQKGHRLYYCKSYPSKAGIKCQ